MFAAVYIRNFSLQAALRHEPDLDAKPVALIDPALPGQAIVQLNQTARNCGVVEGLTASQAAARCEHLTIRTRSLSQEESATEILLQTAYAFSPSIESTVPGVCTVLLKGLGLESPGQRKDWAERISRALAQFHLDAKTGFGITPALALIAARWANSRFGGENALDFLSSLPVEALEPPPQISGILSGWGIRTVGQFLALNREAVAERLGTDGLKMFEHVSIGAIRLLKPVLPPEHYAERIDFDHEIETATPLLFVLRRFVEQLSRRLETVCTVVAEFDLSLGLSSGAKCDHDIKIPSPTGNIGILFRTLQTRLETLRTDSPIVSLQLSAKPARPPAHQFGFFERKLRDPVQLAETLARLSAMAGAENIGSLEPTDSYRPDSFQMRPLSIGLKNPGVAYPSQFAGPSLRRFRPPLAANIEFEAEKPLVIRSSVVRGPICQARGPFASSGNWWDENRWAREEWDIEVFDGRFFRIVRSNQGCLLEGVYD